MHEVCINLKVSASHITAREQKLTLRALVTLLIMSVSIIEHDIFFYESKHHKIPQHTKRPTLTKKL